VFCGVCVGGGGWGVGGIRWSNMGGGRCDLRKEKDPHEDMGREQARQSKIRERVRWDRKVGERRGRRGRARGLHSKEGEESGSLKHGVEGPR